MNIDAVLEQDLKWREAELASLKRLAIVTSAEPVAHQGLLRALWALLYAHFEGFTKFCWDTVLDYIQNQAIPAGELDHQYAMLALEDNFRSLRGNLDSASIWQFFDEGLPRALTANAVFSKEGRLNTESNLWPNVFERETSKLGIECEELEKHRTRIKSLVARRNEIAHGKSMIIDRLSEYHEYENATLCLMYELAIKSIGVIDGNAYKAQVPQ